jgi:hypothetical protein
MGIVFIGDREVGKTALATELSNVKYEYVNVLNQNYEALKNNLYASGTEKFRATTDIYDRPLEIEVRLPIGLRRIEVDWVDTPGEIWRKSWQEDNAEEWQHFLSLANRSEGIMLLLPPHRGNVEKYQKHAKVAEDLNLFINEQQWCKRFERWVDFFSHHCPKARHIAICLNKADLFCDIEQEVSKLAYHPQRSRMNWLQRHTHVYDAYFKPIQSQLVEINKNRSGLSVQCFITSSYHRPLLELPWIYLANYLA